MCAINCKKIARNCSWYRWKFKFEFWPSLRTDLAAWHIAINATPIKWWSKLQCSPDVARTTHLINNSEKASSTERERERGRDRERGRCRYRERERGKRTSERCTSGAAARPWVHRFQKDLEASEWVARYVYAKVTRNGENCEKCKSKGVAFEPLLLLLPPPATRPRDAPPKNALARALTGWTTACQRGRWQERQGYQWQKEEQEMQQAWSALTKPGYSGSSAA